MELFSVACTTCRTRLKVRDQAAIGQILGCPKCGAMVQVVPPPGWQPPAHETPLVITTTVVAPTLASTPRWRDEVAPPRETPARRAAEPANTPPVEVPPIVTPTLVLQYAPPRRPWLPWALVPAAAIVSALGVWYYLRREPPSLPAEPPVDIAAVRAETEQLRTIEQSETPPVARQKAPVVAPLADERRRVAPDAQAVWTLRPNDLQLPSGSSTSGPLGALWSDQIQALVGLAELRLTDIERVTWSTSQLAAPQAHALIELQLRAPIDPKAPWLLRLQPEKLGSQPVFRAAQGKWQHPLLFASERTIVSGPPQVLVAAIEQSIAGRNARGLADWRLLDDDATFALAIDLPAARARGWFAGLDPTRWGIPPGRWQAASELPVEAGLALWLGAQPTAELRLACSSHAGGEQVRQFADELGLVLQQRLATIDVPAVKQAIGSLDGRQVSLDAEHTVRLRIGWVGDAAGLMELAALVDTTAPAPLAAAKLPRPVARQQPGDAAALLSPPRSGRSTVPRAAADLTPIADEPSPEVEAQLAVRIPAIDLQDIPLVSFVGLVSDLSGVSITIDPDGCQEARVPVDQPLTVHQEDAPLGELLDHALADYGLTTVGRGKRLVITSTASRAAGLRRVRSRVADLQPTKAAELVPLVTALVAPASWLGSGGAGRIEAEANDLVIVHSGQVQARVALLLDRLRVARGQAPEHPLGDDGPVSETRLHRWAAVLAQPVSLNFHRPVELAELLAPLGKQAKVQFLFDEPSLLSAGRSPRSPATVAVERMPLADVLAKVLSPLELDYRDVGKNLIQVTSAEELRRRAKVEFYPIADLLRGTRAPDEAVRRLASAGDGGGTIGWQAWQFDAPSSCLLILADEPTHREIERALTRVRSEQPTSGGQHSVLKPGNAGGAP